MNGQPPTTTRRGVLKEENIVGLHTANTRVISTLGMYPPHMVGPGKGDS